MKGAMTFNELEDIISGRNEDYKFIESSYTPTIGSGYVIKEKATKKLFFVVSTSMDSWSNGEGLDYEQDRFTVHEVVVRQVLADVYVSKDSFNIKMERE